MNECNWPACGCQKLTNGPWCKAIVRPSITWPVVQPSPALMEAETNIDLKADFIEKTLNDMAAMSQENYELKIVLTASQAETAANYEMAAEVAIQRKGIGADTMPHPYDAGYLAACDDCAAVIRALTHADSKAALDRMIAEARADGMRMAADIVIPLTPDITDDMLQGRRDVRNAILAAIPKGTPHE